MINKNIMDKKIEYKKLGLDNSILDEEEQLLECQDLDDSDIY